VSAVQELVARMQAADTLACCGLDPDTNRLPRALNGTSLSVTDQARAFLGGVVDVTGSNVCAYKAQKAFFDGMPDGKAVLGETIAQIHRDHPGVPVLVDCKIGDIDNTMDAYTHLLLDELGADGVVVNPYMGDEVLRAFDRYPDKGVVVLVRTSNRGAAIVQDALMQDGRPLWQHMLDLVIQRWNHNGNLIPVISSTAGLNLEGVRQLIPQDMPILLAGVGAQGGDYSDLKALLNHNGLGVFVNSSRGLLYPSNPQGLPWQEAVAQAVVAFKAELNQARR
jgi:orotidine-5'-phosphate decarboxylase